MCGIVACFCYRPDAPPLDPIELDRIRDHMRRRGPDGAGRWLSGDGRVGLGHRRLAIIDLSPKGAQPMALPGSGLRITFNGEIYNYRALRQELIQRGRRFLSDSDTEVLLQAYDEFGPDMLPRLRGMFALAIWDPRRQGLFLARDPFGIKPLYYADDGKRVMAASQVKALLAGGRIDASPSPAGKVSFLLLGNIVEPHTLYRAIQALPAGSWLWIDHRGAAPIERYWSVSRVLAAAETTPPPRLAPAARRQVLRERLQESLSLHQVADVPVGLFLSAGLDSTTLLALASDRVMPPMESITLGFDAQRGSIDDEVGPAERLAAQLRCRHHSQWIDAARFSAERDALFAAMDQPSVDGINVYFVSQSAAAQGLKVALSGLGGDELFAGYPSFHQIPRLVAALARFRRWPAAGRALRRGAAPLLSRLTSPKYGSLLEYGTSIEDAWLLRRGLFLPWELPAILGRDEAEAGLQALALGQQLELCTKGLGSNRARIGAIEMCFYMRNQLLRDSDWAGMAHSLEIRLPLVDAQLFEQLAPWLVGAGGFDKRDMAATPEPPLPPEILTRRKTGFTVPVRDWLMQGAAPATLDQERGLRGWARLVLAHHLAADSAAALTRAGAA